MSPSSRACTRLLGHHLVDGDVLADVAQEVEQRQRLGPVGVVDQRRLDGPGVEVEEALELDLDAGDVGASVSRSSRLRSSLRPLGSPTMPVAPPASGKGRWPASWKRRRVELTEQVADVEAVGGRVEADVHADRSRGQPGAQRLEVGRVVDQPRGLRGRRADPWRRPWCHGATATGEYHCRRRCGGMERNS